MTIGKIASLRQQIETMLAKVKSNMTREEVKAILGEPDAEGVTSRKYPTPCVYKYGEIELHFLPWKNGTLTTVYTEKYLLWVLKKWDCETVEEAEQLAKTDQELNSALRMASVNFCKQLIEAHGGIETITKVMDDWYGIKLSKKQATKLLNKMIESGSYLDCGFDTCCREYAAHMIGEEITGMKWPLGGDTEEYSKQFFVTLIANANKKGYRIDASRYKEYTGSIKLRFE